MKAAPSWLIEKPPASGCSALPPNGQSTVNADIHTNNTTTCLETNNHKRLSVWFNAVLFLDTQVCWQSAHSRKLKGKWIQHENMQRPGLQQKGRLFIVWVCLQIYCADTRQLFFFFFFLSPMNTHTKTTDSYSEHNA